MSSQPSKPNHSSSGLTPKSIILSAAGVALVAAIIQVAGVSIGWDRTNGTEALSTAVMSVLLSILLASGICKLVAKATLVTKAELICFTYIMLMAAPLVSHGFWRLMPATVGGLTREAREYEFLSVLDERMIAFGPETLESASTSTSGAATFESTDDGILITMESAGGAASEVSLTLPLADKNIGFGNSYFFISEYHATGFEPGSELQGVLYSDDNTARFNEFLRVIRDTVPSVYSDGGFEPAGKWGLKISENTTESITLRFRFSGAGKVVLDNPRLYNVTDLENHYAAKPIMDAESYAALDDNRKGAVAERPVFFLSPSGLKTIFVDNIGWSSWLSPMVTWGSFIGITMIAAFGMSVILRKQWVDNERFSMPLMNITDSFMSNRAFRDENGKASPLWTNKLFLAGIALAVIYCASQAMNAYNSSIPSMKAELPVASYLKDPSWGDTWERARFTILSLAFGVGLLMELNILISFVVGYLLYRMQFFFGETTGLATDQKYPHAASQINGSVLAYVILILVLIRKYLFSTIKAAVKGEREDADSISYRTGYIALILSTVLVLIWGSVFGLSMLNMLWLFGVFVAFYFVATKLRAECGVPGIMDFKVFIQWNIGLPLAANFLIFPPAEAVVATFLMILLLGAGLLNLPGYIFEFIEMAKNARIKKWQIPASIVISFIFAMLIGGWFTLNTGNALGVSNVRHFGEHTSRYNDFSKRLGIMESQTVQALEAAEAVQAGEEPPEQGLNGETVGFITGATITGVLTVIRQMFAGFWMHPLGYIYGLTHMAHLTWGALFAAWAVRLFVLKLGGAGTVRRALKPFALGIVAGTIASFFLYTLISIYLYQNGMDESILQNSF